MFSSLLALGSYTHHCMDLLGHSAADTKLQTQTGMTAYSFTSTNTHTNAKHRPSTKEACFPSLLCPELPANTHTHTPETLDATANKKQNCLLRVHRRRPAFRTRPCTLALKELW